MAAKHPLWNEEYWPLLLQLYLEKPVGVKPLYSRGVVDLSLELHIPPTWLHTQMFSLRMMTPRIKRLWERYNGHPQRLARDTQKIRRMRSFGNADSFFEGVEINQSFEKDWLPLEADPSLSPVKLIIILDLYFQLTPLTMVAETPEVVALAALLHIGADLVAQVMSIFMVCDPYLNRADTFVISPLLDACSDVWARYGNGNPDELYHLATELKEYFKD